MTETLCSLKGCVTPNGTIAAALSVNERCNSAGTNEAIRLPFADAATAE